MARKLQITKEMEDALRKANVSEEGIAELRETEIDADVEKLGLDSLDGVSGGGVYGIKEWAPEDFRVPYWYNMTYPEAGELIAAVYDNFGFDVTVDWAMEFFHTKTNDWEKQLRAGGPYYCALYMWSIAYSAHIS